MTDRRAALAGIVLLALAVRLAGIGDTLGADEGYSWLVASAPDADAFLERLAAYENTGHLVLWEQPEPVAADLTRFVENLPT